MVRRRTRNGTIANHMTVKQAGEALQERAAIAWIRRLGGTPDGGQLACKAALGRTGETVMARLKELEKRVRDINGLKESIRLSWVEMASKPMSAAERRQLRQSIDSLVTELNKLRVRQPLALRPERLAQTSATTPLPKCLGQHG
jgi:hypothetical protein